MTNGFAQFLDTVVKTANEFVVNDAQNGGSNRAYLFTPSCPESFSYIFQNSESKRRVLGIALPDFTNAFYKFDTRQEYNRSVFGEYLLAYDENQPLLGRTPEQIAVMQLEKFPVDSQASHDLIVKYAEIKKRYLSEEDPQKRELIEFEAYLYLTNALREDKLFWSYVTDALVARLSTLVKTIKIENLGKNIGNLLGIFFAEKIMHNDHYDLDEALAIELLQHITDPTYIEKYGNELVQLRYNQSIENKKLSADTLIETLTEMFNTLRTAVDSGNEDSAKWALGVVNGIVKEKLGSPLFPQATLPSPSLPIANNLLNLLSKEQSKELIFKLLNLKEVRESGVRGFLNGIIKSDSKPQYEEAMQTIASLIKIDPDPQIANISEIDQLLQSIEPKLAANENNNNFSTKITNILSPGISNLLQQVKGFLNQLKQEKLEAQVAMQAQMQSQAKPTAPQPRQ